jgi:hypothetical protein
LTSRNFFFFFFSFFKTWFESGVKELQWIGDDNSFNLVVIVTDSGGLFVSRDGGATFANHLSRLVGVETSGIAEVRSTAEGASFWALGYGSRVWSSMDGGQTYQFADVPEVVHSLLPSPTDPHAALLETYSPACFSRNVTGACKVSLWLTTDMLKSAPSRIVSDIQQYDWGVGSRIYFSGWETDDASLPTYQRNRSQLALRYTTTSNAPPFRITTLQQRCAGFVQSGNAMWVAVFDPDRPIALSLMYAGSGGFDPLERLVFPTELDEGRYTIVSVDNTALFVNVQHQQYEWGNLYVAPSNVSVGKHVFSLAIARAVRYLDGTVEFARFHGMRGTFIVNVLEDDDIGKFGRKPNKLSLITYDNGGAWHSLAPPAGVSSPCIGVYCRLHVHGIRKKRLHRDRWAPTDFGPLHTKPNTVGIAMATGNVGDGLSDTDVGVYFTRDGGHEWLQVANGSYTYDFADHGALLAAAVNNEDTQLVKWSWNEGLTWTTCSALQNATQQLIVRNIVADPASIGERMMLHGVDSVTKRGVVVHFDFTSLHERSCGADDYEMWSPRAADGGDTPCLLGVTSAYKRRIRDRECYNAEVLEAVASEAVCPCTMEDYGCDVCFFRHKGRNNSDTCESDGDCAAQLWGDKADVKLGIKAPEDCDKTYNQTTGYVLVPGTRCSLTGKGVNLLPAQRECPPRGGGGYIALAVIAVLLVVGGMVGGAFWWRRKTGGWSLEYGRLSSGDDGESRHTVVNARIADTIDVDAPEPQMSKAPEDFNPRA